MPLKTLQDEEPTLNMTPLIDVVFMLIIFFMVGTKFSEWESNTHIESAPGSTGRHAGTGTGETRD